MSTVPRTQEQLSPGRPAPAQSPAPSPTTHPVRSRRGGLWAGLILVVLGVYLLMLNLGFISWWDWRYGGPALLIVGGLLILARRLT